MFRINKEFLMKKLCPVILCGGSGTRLWPLSRDMYPKQFVDLGGGHSLFKDTLRRSRRISPDTLFVVCNQEHRFYVGASLQESGEQGTILLEPAPRNTAPAIALAAFAAKEQGDPLLLVLPSDHVIKNDDMFAASVQQACAVAEQGAIITFGITPTGPETGFGYIRQGAPIADGIRTVDRFVEKPDASTAAAMLQEGGYSWNSGMFLFQASVYLEELRAYAPDMYAACERAWKGHSVDHDFIRPDTEAFLSSPADSIDYAVMERTSRAAVMPLDVRWNDMGSWEAFYEEGTPNAQGNVCTGDVIVENVRNCYLHGTSRLIAALGVEDIAVVETRDAVLVGKRSQLQDVKKIVAELKAQKRPEYRQHPRVFRPWGSYETLALGPRFQVKRITVNPGAQLSLQMHYHRAEHWVVVNGTAEITNGETSNLYTENQSTYIPLGTVHRLKNPGTIPLEIIEIQSGSYLGEDDIVRLDDVYGRDR